MVDFLFFLKENQAQDYGEDYIFFTGIAAAIAALVGALGTGAAGYAGARAVEEVADAIEDASKGRKKREVNAEEFVNLF